MSGNYEYKNLNLTPKMIRELIQELFSGTGETKKENIVNTVTQVHEKRGGLPSKSENIDQIFGVQLTNLKDSGLADSTRYAHWEIY